MTLVRRIARPLLAATFVQGGLDQLRHPGPAVDAARPLVAKAAGPLHLPQDPETFVRANGAAMAGAGVLLALGRFPRLSAAVLAATIVPSTYAGHQFWTESDPERKRQQKQHFMKNVGLLGGAMLAAVDTEGRPGLAWRSRRAAKDAKKAAGHARKDAKKAAGHARKDARRATRHARREAQMAAHRAGDVVHR